MAWLYLLIAGGFEILWTIGLKFSHGFSKPAPSIITIIGLVLSLLFLAQAVKQLPLGTAYAVWTGIGVVGTALLGMAILGEAITIPRIICLVLVVSGIIGLKLTA